MTSLEIDTDKLIEVLQERARGGHGHDMDLEEAAAQIEEYRSLALRHALAIMRLRATVHKLIMAAEHGGIAWMPTVNAAIETLNSTKDEPA